MTKETIETTGMSDRDLLLSTYYRINEVQAELSKLNGRVAAHGIELYGDPTTRVVGMKAQVAENTGLITAWRIGARLLVGFVGFIGLGTLGSLVVFILKLSQ